MEKPHSCGEGLAYHSAVPAKLSDLMASLAANLEQHAGALLDDDEAARTEHVAYTNLVARAKDVAVALRSLADQMSGYRDLPMGGHDIAKMSSPAALGAFERHVEVTRDLIGLLQMNNAGNEQMLAMMKGNAG
jgi:hypothetical protein